MSKILLQIDSCLNVGSTGRITESIAQLAQNKGWDCYIIHGARYVKRPSCMKEIQSISILGEYIHYAEGLFFDNHGLASRKATKRIVEQIREIKPDVIQLHCIHGYYLNYNILFEYLNSADIPVVWTFHDCWAFTGHCAHFVTAGCEKWKTGCFDRPLKGDYPKAIVDPSSRNYYLKKSLFAANNNMHVVAVSEWLANFTRDSFFCDKDIRVINNGVDITKFKPHSKQVGAKFRIVGVATTWNKDKGLHDFYELRKLLDDEYEIMLIGMSQKQVSALPKGIYGITRTESLEELAKLYSEADVFVNPTYADSFPTVNMEALACGTPVITYKTGGSPEIIDDKTGMVVEQGDINGLVSAIQYITGHPLSSDECRKRAVEKYNKEDRFMDYINLYESLIKK